MLSVLFHFEAIEVAEHGGNACRYKMACHTLASKEVWTAKKKKVLKRSET